MISARQAFGWIARACFEGWRALLSVLKPARPNPPNVQPPRPVVTQLAPGIESRVRLDHRSDSPAAVMKTDAPTGQPDAPRESAPPLDSMVSENARLERVVEQAWKVEIARAEQRLLKGSFIPAPANLQTTGAVFQGAVTSSTDPNLVAWVSATPTGGVAAPPPATVCPPLGMGSGQPGRMPG